MVVAAPRVDELKTRTRRALIDCEKRDGQPASGKAHVREKREQDNDIQRHAAESTAAFQIVIFIVRLKFRGA